MVTGRWLKGEGGHAPARGWWLQGGGYREVVTGRWLQGGWLQGGWSRACSMRLRKVSHDQRASGLAAASDAAAAPAAGAGAEAAFIWFDHASRSAYQEGEAWVALQWAAHSGHPEATASQTKQLRGETHTRRGSALRVSARSRARVVPVAGRAQEESRWGPRARVRALAVFAALLLVAGGEGLGAAVLARVREVDHPAPADRERGVSAIARGAERHGIASRVCRRYSAASAGGAAGATREGARAGRRRAASRARPRARRRVRRAPSTWGHRAAHALSP